MNDRVEEETMTDDRQTRSLTTERERRGQCRSFIEFGDDFGDNTTTFHCQLSPKHQGQHLEKGLLYGREFEVRWHKP
jgi:hypothetical protein